MRNAYDKMMYSLQEESILANLENLSLEFMNFIEEIELKSAKVDTLLHGFNHFMTENKKRYYKAIKQVFENEQNNFQEMNQEEIL